MSEENEDYSQWGAPVKCNDLRLGHYVIISKRPCKILAMSTAKTGKHGHAKTHLKAEDIFTERHYETMSPSTHNLYVPVVVKTEYQVLNIEVDEEDKNTGTIDIFDGKSDKKIHLPNQCESDIELAKKIIEEFNNIQSVNDLTLYVSSLATMGEEHIKSMRLEKTKN